MREKLSEICETVFYDLTVEFNPKLSNEKIVEIIKSHFSDQEYIISKQNHTLKAIWEIPADEAGYEVENSMFYVLNDGEYGTYSYQRRVD